MSESNRDRAAALYRAGGTTREVAAALDVDAATVRRWLRQAGEDIRPRGPRPHLDQDAITAARRGGATWAQVADQMGASRSGARRAWVAAGGEVASPSPVAHLTDAQARRLRRLWERLPVISDRRVNAAGEPHRAVAGSEGERLRRMIREAREAGVLERELAEVLGLSVNRVSDLSLGI